MFGIVVKGLMGGCLMSEGMREYTSHFLSEVENECTKINIIKFVNLKCNLGSDEANAPLPLSHRA